MKRKIITIIFLFALIVRCVVAQVVEQQSSIGFVESKINFIEMFPQSECQRLAYTRTLQRVINEVSMKSDDKQQLRELATRPGDYTFVYNNRSYRPEFGIRKQ